MKADARPALTAVDRIATVPDNPSTTRRLLVASAGLLALFLTSCTIPFTERARDPRGAAGGLGLGLTGSYVGEFDGDDYGAVGAYASAWTRYGFSDWFSSTLQASWLVTYPQYMSSLVPADVELGIKSSLSRKSALRLAGGFNLWWMMPSLVELTYIHDFSDLLTGSIGAGTNGVSPAMCFRVQPLGPLCYSIAVRGSYWPLPVPEATRGAWSLSFGLGVEHGPERIPLDAAAE